VPFGPPLHFHREEDEMMFVIDGRVRLEFGGETVFAETGSMVSLPCGIPHTSQVESETARMLTAAAGRKTAPSYDRFMATLGVATDNARIPEPVEIDPARPCRRRPNPRRNRRLEGGLGSASGLRNRSTLPAPTSAGVSSDLRVGSASVGGGHTLASTMFVMRVHFDAEKCQGHNRCYALAPELFDVDDFGQAILIVEGDVPAELHDKARLAASNCPEYAITITESG
jgi:ferredoxin